jgi:hypothetical protein
MPHTVDEKAEERAERLEREAETQSLMDFVWRTESDWRARRSRPARPFRARGIGI